MNSRSFSLLLIIFCCLFASCAKLITSRVIQPAIGNLQQQTDIQLVCEGAPAYLLMLDSMLVASPADRALLLTATQSYSAYTAALAECGEPNEERLIVIAGKAKLYGKMLLEKYLPINNEGQNPAMFDRKLSQLKKRAVPEVFWGAYGWLAWVQTQGGSPASIADVATIEKIMERLLALDETYQNGNIHLFFGAYYAARPAMLGGKPNLSKMHFEKALKLSGRKSLLVQTTYAETLARSIFDQQLHDSLLREVLDFPLESAPEFGLSNRIAVSRAKKLLNEHYFD